MALQAACSAVHANILGHDVTYKLGMPGRHMAMNSLAVLAAASLAGADLALAALSLSQLVPPAGRGVRRMLELAQGEATLIDESYNANPASMAAALNVLGQAVIGAQGRRIAVLGDMLELGPGGPALHSGLNEAIKANRIDLVYCCGPLMRNLWDALSTGKRGGYADSSAGLEAAAGCRDSRRRRDHGQGVARLEDEDGCECARKALSRKDRARRSRGIGRMNVLLAD